LVSVTKFVWLLHCVWKMNVYALHDTIAMTSLKHKWQNNFEWFLIILYSFVKWYQSYKKKEGRVFI